VIVTVDPQRRVTLPTRARPGDVFDLEQTGQGRFTLTRLEQTAPGMRLEQRDGYLVAVTQHPITQEATRRALDEFP
jgi:hypothetical protein